MSTLETDVRPAGSCESLSRGPVAYLFTTFGTPSETFLRRELAAMRSLGVDARVYSLWGGLGEEPQRKVPLWEMLTLFWRAWGAIWEKPEAFREMGEHMLDADIPNWLNFGENWRGIGCAILIARELKKARTRRSHAVWATMPAAAAWLLHHLAGIPYSMGAHAYDIFENGGDWLLPLKLRDATLVHCSSLAARRQVLAKGCEAGKIVVIRRGLNNMPSSIKPLRKERRERLRLVSVGRLVEKKGFRAQLALYAELAKRDLAFEARIVGGGPLEKELQAESRRLGLEDIVRFTGWLDEEGVRAELERADTFIFTGRVTASGDRDGLPNALAEAMAMGLPVLSTRVGAITEVIRHGENGYILPIDDRAKWRSALESIRDDDALCERLRRSARAWVVEHFDAKTNATRLLDETERRIAQSLSID
ncbi:MAG: glycosyltransferase family 4 protein [Opitutales bacterium]|nr:glycosyltransferase family 4 protein [Opitutales bacterium]